MLPTFEDVQSAAARLAGHAHVTPVITSRSLDEACGARVFLKCENLQRVGAFKFRGAWNAISRLSPDVRARGVLAYSSGNHAQAVALVGKLLGAPTTIVMPSTAPTIKREATEAFGAAVVPYDMQTESREAIAKSLQHERGLTLIPPFDHPHVIAGQGTAALELHGQQTGIDTLLVPCGGGGLLTGSALASLGVAPRCRVVGVEPELADDATRSFRTRTLQTVRPPSRTPCASCSCAPSWWSSRPAPSASPRSSPAPSGPKAASGSSSAAGTSIQRRWSGS
jgi:threonine dehydratase